MGEYTVVVTPLATEQVTEAVTYVRDELGMPRAAEQLLDELSSSVEGLSRLPNRFQSVYEDPRGRIVVRRRNVRKYAILYTVDDEGMAVTVFAVLYGSLSDRRAAQLLGDVIQDR